MQYGDWIISIVIVLQSTEVCGNNPICYTCIWLIFLFIDLYVLLKIYYVIMTKKWIYYMTLLISLAQLENCCEQIFGKISHICQKKITSQASWPGLSIIYRVNCNWHPFGFGLLHIAPNSFGKYTLHPQTFNP